ncbi:MazG family protein, partial [Paenibacillus sepulcri]|nr:MazG family protein [Paenibacillus sepulcri]
TVVGLGSGDADQLTLGVWRRLQKTERRFVRTEKHPMMKIFGDNDLTYTSFDSLYEQLDSFPDVYAAITEALIGQAKSLPAASELIYAVPGHPMVAERTVQLLRERCPQEGIELVILGGESFLDQAFTRLGFDPIEGFVLLDAAELKPSQ